MQITELGKHGIRKSIVSMWQSLGITELLPIQATAVTDGGILDGRNAVIFAPTSAGKTFVGEMAAIRAASRLQRVFYLVPQKALAEEKYREFRDRYRAFGINVVISTRDRRDFDRRIHRGEFHIAVVVFEKMQSLLVANPGLLDKVGLVVADELQMVGDKSRGARLEILLTKILLAKAKPQIIGLSAVLGNAEQVAEWMGASLCEAKQRPVELRKGVLHGGEFRYIEHNSGKLKREKLLPAPSQDRKEIIVRQTAEFVHRGEQCIVFCKSRPETQELAQLIASANGAPPADKAIAELLDLEESENRLLLVELLKKGVAYHNADLDWDQRDVIERHFRSGEIAVICATTTLAMGVNMPSKNVFVDHQRWNVNSFGRWGTVNIPQAEYENVSGRAGRLGLEDDFGRAILVATNAFEAESLFDTYVKGDLGSLEPALLSDSLSHHVLNLVASQMARTVREVESILLSSYTGKQFWQNQRDQVTAWIDEAIQECLEGGLIKKTSRGLAATEAGKLAASKGIQVKTAVQMKAFIEANRVFAAAVDVAELFFLLTGTADGESVHFGLSTGEYEARRYGRKLQEVVLSLPETVRNRLWADFEDMVHSPTYENCKRVKKILVLLDWVSGRGNQDIEGTYRCFLGSIYSFAGEFAWLMETLAGMAEVLGWPQDAVARLRDMTPQLLHGVTRDGIELASLRTRGFARGRIMGLVRKGIRTLQDVLEMATDALAKIVTDGVAERVRTIAQRILRVQEIENAQADGQEQPLDATEGPSEPPEWDEQFPPADDMGVSYKLDVPVIVDGRTEKRRSLVKIDGEDIWLTDKSFEVFLQLAVEATTDDLGWLASAKIGDYSTYHQAIRRLRSQIREGNSRVDAEQLIENNACQQYRLSVPPRRIKIKRENILRHQPQLEKILGQPAPKLTAVAAS